MKIALILGLFIALASMGLFAAQQQTAPAPATQPQQEDSSATTVSRAPEQKKHQTKATRVWDNDNIPKNTTSISVIGQPPAPPPDTKPNDAAAAAAQDQAARSDKGANNAPSLAEKKAAAERNLLEAKDQLRSLQVDLNILLRKFILDQQTYHTKPNYAADEDGAASLKDEQDQMVAKRQKIANQQKKIEDLQAALNSLSSDSTNPLKQQ